VANGVVLLCGSEQVHTTLESYPVLKTTVTSMQARWCSVRCSETAVAGAGLQHPQTCGTRPLAQC